MYILSTTNKFLRKTKKIIKKDASLRQKINHTLTIMTTNIFAASLKTHMVTRSNGKKGFSSYVAGDLRIIWEYKNKQAKIIDLVDIGGHSGGNKVYN